MDWSRLKFWRRDEASGLVTPPPLEQRADGWSNQLTGLGEIGRDKGLSSRFTGFELALEEGKQLWQCAALAGKGVEKVPAEMFREGFEFTVPEEKDLAEEVCAVAD